MVFFEIFVFIVVVGGLLLNGILMALWIFGGLKMSWSDWVALAAQITYLAIHVFYA